MVPAGGDGFRRGDLSRNLFVMRFPPPDVSRLLIVGAGGFGREVLQWARDAWPADNRRVCGFLSADADNLVSHEDAPPVIADPATFVPEPHDGLLLAIGIPGVRRHVAETLLARGARFVTLIHPSAIVAPTAAIGPGSIVCPAAVVSDAAAVGRCVLVNYHASIAHDSSVGDYAVLSPYAALAGGARVSEDCFLAMHATVGPTVTLGPRTKVAANSCALRDAPADSLVHGVPGRTAPLPEPGT